MIPEYIKLSTINKTSEVIKGPDPCTCIHMYLLSSALVQSSGYVPMQIMANSKSGFRGLSEPAIFVPKLLSNMTYRYGAMMT